MISPIQKALTLALLSLLIPLIPVFASSPILSLNGIGNGNDVTVSIINADPNVPIILYYNSTLGQATQVQNIGTTNNNGTYTGSISTNAYNISSSAPVYVVINGYQSSVISWPYNASSVGAVSFSQVNPTIIQGQSTSITLAGGSGSYYISNTSNQNVLQATVSGNTLSLYGLTAGSATLIVCTTNNACNTEIVTVITNTSSTGSTFSFSQTNPSIVQGQSVTVTLTGGTGTYYLSTNSNAGAVQATLLGNTLTLYGTTVGSAALTICSTGSGCAVETVTVTNTLPQTLSPVVISIPLSVGQTSTMSLSGGNGMFVVSPQVTTSFTASISGNRLFLTGSSVGDGSVTICSNNTPCSSIHVIITQSLLAKKTIESPSNTSKHIFTEPLSVGMKGHEVLELQKYLFDGEYLLVIPNGVYGKATVQAVKKYQREHGLSALGSVGPGTREELNK